MHAFDTERRVLAEREIIWAKSTSTSSEMAMRKDRRG
jgi:hypothetical protein